MLRLREYDSSFRFVEALRPLWEPCEPELNLLVGVALGMADAGPKTGGGDASLACSAGFPIGAEQQNFRNYQMALALALAVVSGARSGYATSATGVATRRPRPRRSSSGRPSSSGA